MKKHTACVLCWDWVLSSGIMFSRFIRTEACVIASFFFFFFPHSSLLLLFSRSVVSDSLPPHGLQHPSLPCPSPSPGVRSDSCPLWQWSRLTIPSHAFLWSGNILWLDGQPTHCFPIHPPVDIWKVSISLAIITNSTECPRTSSTAEIGFLTQLGVELLHHSKRASRKIDIQLYFKENARLYVCVCTRASRTEPGSHQAHTVRDTLCLLIAIRPTRQIPKTTGLCLPASRYNLCF